MDMENLFRSFMDFVQQQPGSAAATGETADHDGQGSSQQPTAKVTGTSYELESDEEGSESTGLAAGHTTQAPTMQVPSSPLPGAEKVSAVN